MICVMLCQRCWPFCFFQAIKAKQDEPKRAQRATSNVFAMFRQAQVQEFKEV